MSGLFMKASLPQVPVPPSAPALSDPAVQQAGADAQAARQQASGRASTFLTDAQAQRSPQKNQQRYLGGA